MNIVVLCGGLSTERAVSLTTGAKVQNALIEKLHHAIAADLLMGYELNGSVASEFEGATKPVKIEAISETVPDLEKVKVSRKEGTGLFGKNILELCRFADVVFMALHGGDGENGRLQAAFDLMDIRYTGSGYLGSAIAMHKGLTKQAFIRDGILTPKGERLKKGDSLREMKLPLVIKPCSGGSSIGVFIVNTEEELKKGMEEAFKYEDELVIEEYVKGREFSCGVLGGEALPPIEIIPKEGWYDYKNKYQPGLTTEICPAQIDKEAEEKMRAAAVAAFKSLRLGGYARMDFILTDSGEPYCLEANTLPGMTPTSLIPQEAAAAGIEYGDLCEKIIDLALKEKIR